MISEFSLDMFLLCTQVIGRLLAKNDMTIMFCSCIDGSFLCRYASQVAQFFEFVKKRKEQAPSTNAGMGGNQNQPQVLLPPKGGLWMPDGEPFHESALGSLDFRKLSLMTG